MNDDTLETIWTFLRGEMNVTAFEAWVYEHEAALLQPLGASLHMDLLWLDFRDVRAVDEMARRLRQVLTPLQRCACQTMAAREVYPSASHDTALWFMTAVKRIVNHGPHNSWVWLGRCEQCGQHWIVAHYDPLVVEKVTPDVAEGIVSKGIWPSSIDLEPPRDQQPDPVIVEAEPKEPSEDFKQTWWSQLIDRLHRPL